MSDQLSSVISDTDQQVSTDTSIDHLNSLITDSTSSVQNNNNNSKPHSVPSLSDLPKEIVIQNDDTVKSDSQLLNNLNDEFTKLSKNDSLSKSVENLKEQTSLEILTTSIENDTSMNNLLLERSISELNRAPLTNTPIDEPFLNEQIILKNSLNQRTLNTSDHRKLSLKQPDNELPEKASSLNELHETNEKFNYKAKQSTGSIDFIPNFIANQSQLDKNQSTYRINVGLEDEMIIESYRSSISKEIIYYLISVFTFGLLLIYCEVKKSFKIRLTHNRCSLDVATVIILIDNTKFEFVELICRPNKDEDEFSNEFTHFFHKKIKYIWNSDQLQFIRLTGLESEKCEVIYSYKSGLTHQEAEEKFNLYGLNSIYIDVKPLWKIVLEAVQNPFYIYQAFIVIVWCIQVYYSFAFCVLCFSIVTIALQGAETRKQDKLLRAKVQSESEVTVIRNSCATKMSSNKLVPGDLLLLNGPCALNCDAVLIEGTCTVNESMLTGECVPIAKNALSMSAESIYSPKVNKKNTLYCGTEILQIQAHHAKAVVVRTGYSTAKGELVRAILFPKDLSSLLASDLSKCLMLFFLMGVPAMTYTALIFYSFKLPTFELIMVSIDVATFLVPPLLPSVMTSINVHAQKRLLKMDIFCLNAVYINSCGVLDSAVFDKTGTITEDSLDFASVLSTTSKSEETHNLLSNFIRNEEKEDENLNEIKNSKDKVNELIEKSKFTDEAWTIVRDREVNNLIMTVGCCHSLINFDQKVDGDILDLKMFEQLDWQITDSEEDLNKFSKCCPLKLERVIKTNISKENCKLAIGIVKDFQFESNLQRMLVICKPFLYTEEKDSIQPSSLNNNNYLVLTKGAPEMIERFCKHETIPLNYNEILYSYTVQGLRVIASASKIIDLAQLDNLTRSQITDFESDLSLDGLIVFHNRLKRQSKPTIEELKVIDIRCLMATGDNLLTGVNVARNCGLIGQEELVIKLKAEIVDNKVSFINSFIDRNEYVEYVKSDQQVDSQIKLTYKILKDPSTIQHRHLTDLFRKESHHYDQDEVIINMLDNSLKKRKKEVSPRSKEHKNRLNKTIDEMSSPTTYHLCCEGNTFQMLKYHNQRIFNYLTHKGVVFARMSPNQKEQLITSLQKQEHSVAMVGDGANDCAALRNANCGLSLSSGESAVAAPFSTTHSNISVFKFLICEGKASITATFGAFKYQVSYCFILLVAVMILFYDGCTPSDTQYVLTDIVLNLLPPMVFGTTAAYYKLVKRRPSSCLFGFDILFSIFSFVFLQSCFYFFARWLLTQQVWYEPYVFSVETLRLSPPSHIATSILSVNVMSYVISAIIFSPGHPFRKSIFSNKLYMAVVLLNLLVALTISFYPTPKFLMDYINFKEFPEFRFKVYLLGISVVNFIVSYFWEVILLQNVLPKLQVRYPILDLDKKVPIYQKLEHELNNINWPPVLYESKA